MCCLAPHKDSKDEQEISRVPVSLIELGHAIGFGDNEVVVLVTALVDVVGDRGDKILAWSCCRNELVREPG